VVFSKEIEENDEKSKDKDEDDSEPDAIPIDSLVLIFIGIGAVIAVMLFFLKAGGKKKYKTSDKARKEIEDIFEK